ncbi:thioredoxin family protein [Rhodovibrionaceae bacterium A322]
MAVSSSLCDFGWKAPDFTLPATDGRTYGFADVAGQKGTVIVFMCNHCPYVIAVLDRLVREALALQDLGIGVAAINANDTKAYPADSFDRMKVLADEKGFSFPYLFDESQQVARAYDAVCTPDFFGFDASGGLQYRGRLDSGANNAAAVNPDRDLYNAMMQVASGAQGPMEQIASMGCSIKWKAA